MCLGGFGCRAEGGHRHHPPLGLEPWRRSNLRLLAAAVVTRVILVVAAAAAAVTAAAAVIALEEAVVPAIVAVTITAVVLTVVIRLGRPAVVVPVGVAVAGRRQERHDVVVWRALEQRVRNGVAGTAKATGTAIHVVRVVHVCRVSAHLPN